MPKTAVLILAAGMGTRMGGVSKSKLRIDGKTVIKRTFEAFCNSKLTDAIIISARADEVDWIKNECIGQKPVTVTVGGKTRQESAFAAFLCVPDDCDYVAFHDAARCLIEPSQIDKIIGEAHSFGAAVAATKVTDTLKTAADGVVLNTVDRSKLYAVQTPQVFKKTDYAKAIKMATEDETDDCAVCENIGVQIKLVDIGKNNIKLTTPDDVKLAQAILGKNEEKMLRIGHGYDAHRLVTGRKLMLGGADVPYEYGLDGHSDADVLLHAVCDALLGAAALGDIGKHFPPSDEKYKDISSLFLLERTASVLADNGYKVLNIDATVIAQKPKLAEYIPLMRKNIAHSVGIDEECVSVKATTEEKMGFTGALEGISAHSVCMISK